MSTSPASTALSKLSRQDLVHLCEIYKAKAFEEHDRFRHWQARCVEAEQRLAIYEPGDEPTNPEERRMTHREDPERTQA